MSIQALSRSQLAEAVDAVALRAPHCRILLRGFSAQPARRRLTLTQAMLKRLVAMRAMRLRLRDLRALRLQSKEVALLPGIQGRRAILLPQDPTWPLVERRNALAFAVRSCSPL